VPDKGTQNKIASMLSQYDDKIELNERINKNLAG
jgi:restriction endonuclease S subunit